MTSKAPIRKRNYIHVRVNDFDKARYMEACREQDISMSELIRRQMRALVRLNGYVPPKGLEATTEAPRAHGEASNDAP